jgi:RNA polymerase sigma-70 factor (ECF subfamily)
MNTMGVGALSMNSAIPIDKRELAGIYERFSAEIYRYAYRLLDNSDIAEECVAETFSRFLMALRGGTRPENVRAYLYRIAHNWITDHYRCQPLLMLHLEDDLYAEPDENPASQVAQDLEHQRMRAALLLLPAEQRQVIELRFLEDWSHEDVANLLGKTAEATRALQHRALEALRRMLID